MYSPINTINNSFKNINKILNVYNINNKLIIENDKLKNISNEIIKLQSENQKLTKLLNLSNNIKYEYITAKIISRSNSSFIRSVILMAGNKDKLSLGSPVVYNNYLLGYINELGANSSRVLSITDINIKVPSIIIEKNIKFIITGSNKKFLEILNYGDLSSLKSGDKVFTSGDGNMYPEGLIIGTVRINNNGDFVIEPSVDLNNINYVQIINWKPSDRGIDINLDPVFYD
jgi:rod shape-determining protein MreC